MNYGMFESYSVLNVKTKMEHELRNGEKYVCSGKFKPKMSTQLPLPKPYITIM